MKEKKTFSKIYFSKRKKLLLWGTVKRREKENDEINYTVSIWHATQRRKVTTCLYSSLFNWKVGEFGSELCTVCFPVDRTKCIYEFKQHSLSRQTLFVVLELVVLWLSTELNQYPLWEICYCSRLSCSCFIFNLRTQI